MDASALHPCRAQLLGVRTTSLTGAMITVTKCPAGRVILVFVDRADGIFGIFRYVFTRAFMIGGRVRCARTEPAFRWLGMILLPWILFGFLLRSDSAE